MDKNLIDNQPTTPVAAPSGAESQQTTYEYVNHPNHYNNYNIEVIDMMEKIWGPAYVLVFCQLNAFKYRMRMGTKPGESVLDDLQKEHWYLQKAEELKKKLEKNK